MPNTFKILPKRWYFAQSGHTESRVLYFSVAYLKFVCGIGCRFEKMDGQNKDTEGNGKVLAGIAAFQHFFSRKNFSAKMRAEQIICFQKILFPTFHQNKLLTRFSLFKEVCPFSPFTCVSFQQIQTQENLPRRVVYSIEPLGPLATATPTSRPNLQTESNPPPP